jgi:trimeric autotransporter adhesin
MKPTRIRGVCALIGAGLLTSAGEAGAITVPDLANVCTAANGANGCFAARNGHGGSTPATSASAGTAITASVTGSSAAVKGFTDGNSSSVGVFGISSTSATGVTGVSVSGNGIIGTSTSGTGVRGTSTGGTAIDGFCGGANGTAISGQTTGTGGGAKGVFGSTPNGMGVHGTSTFGAGIGVQGDSSGGVGVKGITSSGTGTYGGANTGVAIHGESNTGNAVLGVNFVTDMSAAAISAVPGSTSALAFWGGGGIQLAGSFAEKVGGGSWSAPSDRRIKKDVRDLERGLPDLMRVRPVTFKYNGLGGTEDNGKEYIGVIAQELEKVLPNMVSTRSGKLHKDDAQATQIEIVDPSAFTFLLINAVKQQQRTIEQQQRTAEKQETRIADLERRNGPIAAAGFAGGPGGWAALALLLPIGLVIGRRRPRA